jgi:isopenicillin N synthase-like dioxygenase
MRDTIPVIDISATRAAGVPVGDVARRVDRACRDVGFFAVTGHGLDDDLRAGVLAAARDFFALPSDVKQAVSIEDSPNHRGYSGIAAERLQPDLPADLKESFDIGLEMAADDQHMSPLDGPNRWPDMPGLSNVLLDYQDRAMDVAVLVMRIIAVANRLPADFFDACHEHSLAALRILRYPQADQRSAAAQLGCGAHSDYGSLTLLYTDGTPGLQLLTADGDWVEIDVPDGALVVNIGDLLQRWTNDAYRSTMHRVIPPVDRDRYAVPLFVTPSWSTQVTCLPSCSSAGNPPRYQPVLAGEYLMSRFQDTYAYLGEAS